MDCVQCEYRFHEFLTLVREEDKLHDFLKQHNVVDFTKEFKCPKCDKPCTFVLDRCRFVCITSNIILRSRKRVRVKCNFSQAAKKNTIFENSKKSMSEICTFILYWLYEFKQRDFEEQLKWSDKTIIDWSSFCRKVCFVAVNQTSERLGGAGKIVIMNEAKFDPMKIKRGKNIEGQWVFGGMERESKKVFLVPVDNKNKETLLDTIKEWILPETTVMSEFWSDYDCLNEDSFQDLTLNHGIKFVDPDSGTHNVTRIWRNVSKDILKPGRKECNFVFYLAEYYFHKQFPNKLDRLHPFFKYVSEVCPPTVSINDEEGSE